MKTPKSWNDITIKKFYQISDLDTSLDKIELAANLISICCDIPHEDVLSMPISKFTSISNDLSFLSNKNINEKIIYNFEISEMRFVLNLNIEKLKASEYIDISSYCVDVNKNLHKIMAVLCDGGDMSFRDKSELFYNKLPITIAYPAAVFFCKLSSNSISGIGTYLKSKMKRVARQTEKLILRKKALLANGGGL